MTKNYRRERPAGEVIARVTEPDPQRPVLRSTLELADPDERDLVRRFVARLPVQAEAIRAAVASGDMAGLRRVLHQLKGSGGSYGFAPISVAAAAAEQAIDAAHPAGEVAALAGELLSLVARVEGYVAPTESAAA